MACEVVGTWVARLMMSVRIAWMRALSFTYVHATPPCVYCSATETVPAFNCSVRMYCMDLCNHEKHFLKR